MTSTNKKPRKTDEAGLTRLHIRIAKQLDRAVEVAAAVQDCSKQALIERALRAYLGPKGLKAAAQ